MTTAIRFIAAFEKFVSAFERWQPAPVVIAPTTPIIDVTLPRRRHPPWPSSRR